MTKKQCAEQILEILKEYERDVCWNESVIDLNTKNKVLLVIENEVGNWAETRNKQ